MNLSELRRLASSNVVRKGIDIARRGEIYISRRGRIFFMIRGETGFHTAYLDLLEGRYACSCIGFITHGICKHLIGLLSKLYNINPRLYKLGVCVIERGRSSSKKSKA